MPGTPFSITKTGSFGNMPLEVDERVVEAAGPDRRRVVAALQDVHQPPDLVEQRRTEVVVERDVIELAPAFARAEELREVAAQAELPPVGADEREQGGEHLWRWRRGRARR